MATLISSYLPALARAVVIAAVLSLLHAGCVSSSGSAFETVATAEQQGTAADEPGSGDGGDGGDDGDEDSPQSDDEPAGLEIDSAPAGAQVYLNGTRYGETPLLIEDLASGRYEVVLRKRGYRSSGTRIFYDGVSGSYHAVLEEITGRLRVTTEPFGAMVHADGVVVAGGDQTLRIGEYQVRVRAFGFEDHTATVEIHEDRLTELAVQLEPAAFRVSAARTSRRLFNPRNPGLLGRVRVSFEVSAPGSGTVTVQDAAGTAVRVFRLPPFVDWQQAVDWDGRDQDGAPVADGSYRAVIAGTGADGRSAEAQVSVEVDSTAVVSFRSMWSGSSGTMLAPTAEVLPPGMLQAAFLAVGHRSGGGAGLLRAPVHFGVRAGVADGLELDAALSGVVWEGSSTLPALVSAALKYAVIEASTTSPLAAGLVARIAYQADPTTDTFTNFPGLGLTAAATLRAANIVLSAAPELVLSPWEPLHAAGAVQDAPWEAWLNLRAGALLDLGTVTAGLSAALRTEPFDQGLALATDLPLKAAAEVHWMFPETLLLLSGALQLEVTDADNWFLEGGVGMGVLF